MIKCRELEIHLDFHSINTFCFFTLKFVWINVINLLAWWITRLRFCNMDDKTSNQKIRSLSLSSRSISSWTDWIGKQLNLQFLIKSVRNKVIISVIMAAASLKTIVQSVESVLARKINARMDISTNCIMLTTIILKFILCIVCCRFTYN